MEDIRLEIHEPDGVRCGRFLSDERAKGIAGNSSTI
jgi:hypothetical protein